MSKDNAAELIKRADRWLSSNLTMESNGETRYALIRDLRNRVVELEAQQSSLREKIEALRERLRDGHDVVSVAWQAYEKTLAEYLLDARDGATE